MTVFFGGFNRMLTGGETQRNGQSPSIRPASPRFGNDRDSVELTWKKVAKAEQKAQAEIDPLDYISSAFNVDGARDYLERDLGQAHGLDGTPELSGKDFLQFLITDGWVDPSNPPSRQDAWKEAYFPRLGRSEKAIQEFLKARTDDGKRFPDFVYGDFLKEAKNKGLIYGLVDPKDHQYYYGVPPHVREALNLEPMAGTEAARNMDAAESGDPVRQAFIEELKPFLERIAKMPEEVLLQEYAAQVALAAVDAGLLKPEDFPKPLQEVAKNLELFGSLTSLESLQEEAPDPSLAAEAQKLVDLALEARLL